MRTIAEGHKASAPFFELRICSTLNKNKIYIRKLQKNR